MGAFAMLQLGVPLCALVAMMLVPNPFDRPPESSADLATRAACVLVWAVTTGAVGVGAALIARRIAPDQECGGWIWIIPSSFVLLGFVWDSLLFSVHEALSEFFLPEPDGEAWYLVMFLTCPTIACITCSAAFHLQKGPRREPRR